MSSGCKCGSNCSCGSGCSCEMYVEKSTSIAMVAPVIVMMYIYMDPSNSVRISKRELKFGMFRKIRGAEKSLGGEGGNGCKCGSNCSCDPCKC